MSINDALHNISAIIVTEAPGVSGQGTGFFYSRLAPTEKDGPQWRQIEDMWVVTNRHEIVPRPYDSEIAPSKVTLNLRQFDDSNRLFWDPVEIKGDQVGSLIKVHRDAFVDLAIINIADIFISRIQRNQRYLPPRFLSSDNFAGKNKIEVEASSDVLVVGYPRGYYDEVNLFPFVKSGIIASKWGSDSEGNRIF